MGTHVTTQEYYEPPEGAQITPTDWINLYTNMDDSAGWVLASLGITNALPANNPVAVTPTGGLGLTLAGPGTFMVAQGIVLDSCPSTSEILATADPSHPRIDLIAVQANRAVGSATVSRNVRPDSATLPLVQLGGTLVAGTCTVTLPSGYTSAPVVNGLAPVGTSSAGSLRVTSISTTQVIISSTDGADTRTFNLEIYGTPTGSTGTTQSIGLFENRPVWQVVTGTPAVSPVKPPTPIGYEDFATILVPTAATVLLSGNISILFPMIISLVGGSGSVLSSNGSSPMLGGGTMKWGVASSVPADGSVIDLPVSFNAPFATSVFQVIATIDCGSAWSGSQLSLQVDSISTSGFKVTVSGGAPGLTVNVRYTAIGL